jgi:hypothetical protein
MISADSSIDREESFPKEDRYHFRDSSIGEFHAPARSMVMESGKCSFPDLKDGAIAQKSWVLPSLGHPELPRMS